jgi:hypothetical protein
MSNHFFLGFPVERFPSGIFLDPFFRVLSSDILSTCPNHRSFSFLICNIWFFLQIHQLLKGADHPYAISEVTSCIIIVPDNKIFGNMWTENEWVDLSI